LLGIVKNYQILFSPNVKGPIYEEKEMTQEELKKTLKLGEEAILNSKIARKELDRSMLDADVVNLIAQFAYIVGKEGSKQTYRVRPRIGFTA
jgi:hypothetical protein